MPDPQPLKYCTACRKFKSYLEFQASGTVKCRSCSQETVYGFRDGVVRGRPAPPELTVCPLCELQVTTTEELVRHLHDRHRVTSGKERGLVLGLDLIYCFVCKRAFKATFMDHLRKRHQMSGQEYLERFPFALLTTLRSSDVGGGRLTVGQRRRLSRTLLNKVGQRCERCGSIPEDMVLHLRHTHHVIDLDYHEGYGGPNGPLVRRILDQRRDEDRYWRWPLSRKLIYFIQAGAPDRPIKIGFTQRIHHRLRQFQTDVPDPLVILATIPGDHEDESALHERFMHLNVRREWFRPEVELLEFIQEGALLPNVPSELRGGPPIVPLTPLERMWASIED